MNGVLHSHQVWMGLKFLLAFQTVILSLYKIWRLRESKGSAAKTSAGFALEVKRRNPLHVGDAACK